MYQRYHNSIERETEEATQKELATWIQEDVYKEVPNKCQNTVSTCLVVSPKVIDSIISTKAHLVRRGFKGKEDQIIRSCL